jgi:protein-arginine kinase activator protein McsA
MVKDKEYYKGEVDLLIEQIQSDKRSLRLAIAQEKYEQAAILRDQLKERQKNFIHYLANIDLPESTQR